MPKILQMPKRGHQFKSKDYPGGMPSPKSADQIQLPNRESESSEIARISDWLKLADRVLGDNKTPKKV
jgi:hypothetical protein